MDRVLRLGIVPLIILLLFFSCKKETFFTGSDARVSLSSDTVRFDTVFTSAGSVTDLILIYNDNDGKLLLDKVTLAGGEASPFRINADGSPGPEIRNIEIAARDSIYIFITVKIDPTTVTQPFLVSDSIEIQFNGTSRMVQLQAYGQNANFLRTYRVASDEVWTNEKPYVILGGLQVMENAVLTIEEGTQIYVHADGPILVDGTLVVNGNHYDSTWVTFRSDRLDAPYRHYPAGWPGIFFRNSSKNNVLNYAKVLNAYQGIVVEGLSQNMNPKVQLNQLIIDNCYDAGLLAVGADVEINNTLVSNCGKGIILAYGGKYRLTHCTVAAVSNQMILHKEPSLLITDFIKDGDQLLSAPLDAHITNCIIWGDGGAVEDEVVVGREGIQQFSVRFEHSVWKIKNEPAGVQQLNMLNADPLFDTLNSISGSYNFRLRDNSPAINHGLPAGLLTDLDGRPRNSDSPDAGAYEKD